MREYAAIHKAADYYEPLLRTRIARAMKLLRKQVTVTDIALAIQMRHTKLFETRAIMKALLPAAKVVRDAVRQGGKLGAERVRSL